MLDNRERRLWAALAAGLLVAPAALAEDAPESHRNLQDCPWELLPGEFSEEDLPEWLLQGPWQEMPFDGSFLDFPVQEPGDEPWFPMPIPETEFPGWDDPGGDGNVWTPVGN